MSIVRQWAAEMIKNFKNYSFQPLPMFLQPPVLFDRMDRAWTDNEAA